MMSRWSILLFAVCLATLSACSEGNVALDNPGKVATTFTVDGTAYEVPAGSTEFISLDAGAHKVTAGSLKDAPFTVKESGLLHSGDSSYLTWKILYGLPQYRKTELKEDTVEVDSILFYGDIRVHPPTEYYIEGPWDYKVNEPLPESKDLYVNKDFVIKSKLYRKADFFETYKRLSGQD